MLVGQRYRLNICILTLSIQNIDLIPTVVETGEGVVNWGEGKKRSVQGERQGGFVLPERTI